MKKKLLILSELWTPFTKSKAAPYASACCYYFLLSIPATVIVLFSVIVVFMDSWALPDVLKLIPGNMKLTLEIIAEYYDKPSVGLLSFSFITATWSAAKGVSSLQEGLRVVTNVPKHGFFRRRLWAMTVMVISIPLSTFILMMLGAAQTILSVLSSFLGETMPGLHIILNFPAFVTFCMLWSVLFLLYAATLREIKTKHIAIITIGVSAVCVIISHVFSAVFRYTLSGGRQDLAFAVLIAAMIWLRTMNLIILYGAILCKICSVKSYHPLSIIRRMFRS